MSALDNLLHYAFFGICIFICAFPLFCFVISFAGDVSRKRKIQSILSSDLFGSEFPLAARHTSGLFVIGRCDEIRTKSHIAYIIDNKRRDIKRVTEDDIAELSIYRYLASKNIDFEISKDSLIRFVDEDGSFEFELISLKSFDWAENLINRYVSARQKTTTTQIASIERCSACRYALDCYKIDYPKSALQGTESLVDGIEGESISIADELNDPFWNTLCYKWDGEFHY